MSFQDGQLHSEASAEQCSASFSKDFSPLAQIRLARQASAALSSLSPSGIRTVHTQWKAAFSAAALCLSASGELGGHATCRRRGVLNLFDLLTDNTGVGGREASKCRTREA